MEHKFYLAKDANGDVNVFYENMPQIDEWGFWNSNGDVECYDYLPPICKNLFSQAVDKLSFNKTVELTIKVV